MDLVIVQSYLADVLHIVSQALLAPTIIVLLALMGYALFCIGSVVSEYYTERRNFKVAMPRLLADLMAAGQDRIPSVIERSGLLNRQKEALLTVFDYRTLPGDALIALIRRLVSEEEARYDRITGRDNIAAKVSPMVGLMGTLIPLGPGIVALGHADTAALSSSLLIAFDTTVAGLVAAAVCLAVGKVRSNWYDDYMTALDAAMATLLQKVEEMRAAGEITVKEPTDYAALFGKGLGKAAGAGDAAPAPGSGQVPARPRTAPASAALARTIPPAPAPATRAAAPAPATLAAEAQRPVPTQAVRPVDPDDAVASRARSGKHAAAGSSDRAL